MRETELDIDNVIGVAPGASIRVYQGPNSDQGALDTYNAMVTNPAINVISTSWGLCEAALSAGDVSSEATIFQEAAVQGRSVVAAAGDDGAQDCYGIGVSCHP